MPETILLMILAFGALLTALILLFPKYKNKTVGVYMDDVDMCLKCDTCKTVLAWYSDICTDEELECHMIDGDMAIHPSLSKMEQCIHELKECPICRKKLIFGKNYSRIPIPEYEKVNFTDAYFDDVINLE